MRLIKKCIPSETVAPRKYKNEPHPEPINSVTVPVTSSTAVLISVKMNSNHITKSVASEIYSSMLVMFLLLLGFNKVLFSCEPLYVGVRILCSSKLDVSNVIQGIGSLDYSLL